MKKTFWQALALAALGVCALVLSIRAGGAGVFIEGHRLPRGLQVGGQKIAQVMKNPLAATPAQAQGDDPHGVLTVACKLRPEPSRRFTRAELRPVRLKLGLDRFRANGGDQNRPKEMIALAHPTNFGWRYKQDAFGKNANQPSIVVLHETVSSASSTINYFQTPHPNDNDQVSYHTLIDLDGTVIYMVPPDKRAYGAGNSQFNGLAVKTNPKLSASVNNFAYHISLVTPRDGRNNKPRHSGYTSAQYESLAWVLAKTGIPETNITAHKLVDRGGVRSDPRSFDGPRILNLLKKYPRSADMLLSCQ